VSVFKACDLRGLAGAEMNEVICRKVGLALGVMAHERGGGPVCVGGDFRRSTPALKGALCAGLMESGATVFDAGQNPTPSHYFAARHLGCPNAAIVTASHNPGKYNGVKFMIAGRPAVPSLVSDLRSRVERAEVAKGKSGRCERVDVTSAYVEHMLTASATLAGSTREALQHRRLRVAVDAMGGAFSMLGPAILERAGCEVVPLACAIDPDFAARSPNPAADKNLTGIREVVAREGADLGMALDGDGDRVTILTRSGAIIRPEQLGVLLIRHCLAKPTVVCDLKCASILPRAAEKAGGRAIMRPSGHGFIKSEMMDQNGDLGIEVSGHVFLKALHGGDDGMFTALTIAHLLARRGVDLDAEIRAIGWPCITPDLRVPLPRCSDDLLERIAASCGGAVTRLDGVRVEYADGWALARMSITEPVITLRFEGRTAAETRTIAKRFLANAPELLEAVLGSI
jgi:phosphomannomutase/phosphoglucomutase